MEIPVFFNREVKINGDLIFGTDVHIDCETSGSIECESKLIIGVKGVVCGTLLAKELVVFGKLEGDVVVLEKVVLHSGSSLSGTLSARIIEIKDGTILDAKISITEPYVKVDKAVTPIPKPENNTRERKPVKKDIIFEMDCNQTGIEIHSIIRKYLNFSRKRGNKAQN